MKVCFIGSLAEELVSVWYLCRSKSCAQCSGAQGVVYSLLVHLVCSLLYALVNA